MARLSPLKNAHINFLGCYLFNITASAPGQGLRPFRDPGDMEEDEDQEGRVRAQAPAPADVVAGAWGLSQPGRRPAWAGRTSGPT